MKTREYIEKKSFPDAYEEYIDRLAMGYAKIAASLDFIDSHGIIHLAKKDGPDESLVTIEY